MDTRSLLTARLWVARLGEGDVHRWWRTDGILGPDGAFVGPRVLPRTHTTARTRIAFAVARHACLERYPAPESQSLFSLDPVTEDLLDAYLLEQLVDFDGWAATIAQLEVVGKDASIAAVLLGAKVVTDRDLDYARSRPLGPDRRSLPMAPGADSAETLRRLAAGFVQSAPGQLAVPYLVAER